MRGELKTTRISMLEDLEKHQDYEKPDEGGKRKRTESKPSGSHQTLKIELEKFGANLTSPIVEPAAEVEEIELYAGYSGKMVRIGKSIEPAFKDKIIKVVRQYNNVFTWGLEDIPDLDPKTAKYCLNVQLKVKPVKQKKMEFCFGKKEGH